MSLSEIGTGAGVIFALTVIFFPPALIVVVPFLLFAVGKALFGKK